MQNRHIAKQGQPDDQPHDMLCSQLSPTNRGLASGLRGVLNRCQIDQIVESAQISPLLPGE
jgi:hypothetical protein